MDFFNLSSNGMGAVETVSTLASGDSIVDAGKNLAKRALSKKFEKVLIDSADAYVAGYSSVSTENCRQPYTSMNNCN